MYHVAVRSLVPTAELRLSLLFTPYIALSLTLFSKFMGWTQGMTAHWPLLSGETGAAELRGPTSTWSLGSTSGWMVAMLDLST
jgi:hypothetical protein